MQFFHGKKEASKILHAEPAGSLALRTNEKDEYRITLKKENHIEHMKIYSRDSNYFLNGNETKPFSSLRILVDHLKEDKQTFSIPLKSALQERKTSLGSQPPLGIEGSPIAGLSVRNRLLNLRENSFQ